MKYIVKTLFSLIKSPFRIIKFGVVHIFDLSPDWSFYKFVLFAEKYAESESRPAPHTFFRSLSLSKDLREIIQDIMSHTEVLGKEHGISIFFADSDLVTSKIVKGEKSHIRFAQKISLSYKWKERDVFTKRVEIDGEKMIERSVEKEKIPKNPKVSYLMHIHSHPLHSIRGAKFYSLFSEQDIRALLSSKDNFTGLVTDRFWMLAKTSYAKTSLDQESKEMLESMRYFRSEDAHLKKFLDLATYLGLFLFSEDRDSGVLKRVQK